MLDSGGLEQGRCPHQGDGVDVSATSLKTVSQLKLGEQPEGQCPHSTVPIAPRPEVIYFAPTQPCLLRKILPSILVYRAPQPLTQRQAGPWTILGMRSVSPTDSPKVWRSEAQEQVGPHLLTPSLVGSQPSPTTHPLYAKQREQNGVLLTCETLSDLPGARYSVLLRPHRKFIRGR